MAVNGLRLLTFFENGWIGWIWLEMAGTSWKLLEWLEVAPNSWEWLEIADNC